MSKERGHADIDLRVSVAHFETDEPGISLICNICNAELTFVNTPTTVRDLIRIADRDGDRCQHKKLGAHRG